MTDQPAPWWTRAVALFIDTAPGAAVVAAMVLTGWAVPLRSVWWWICVAVAGLALLLTVANRVLLPPVTGWSLGRALVGIAVRRRDGDSPGSGRLVLRDLAHLLDTVSVFIGWLWPLWDRRRRTFADILARTEVHRMTPPWPARDRAALGARVFLAAALVCVLAAAMDCLVVYQRDRGIAAARTEVAAQGPKMVEQMLSYEPESLQDDLARARSLATDRYREEFAVQQQAAQKGPPVPNAYRVVNSSVLPGVTPDRASMLLFLQGQRGTGDAEQFLSATLRVAFAKSGARWRVDDLTVVNRPVPAEDGN